MTVLSQADESKIVDAQVITLNATTPEAMDSAIQNLNRVKAEAIANAEVEAEARSDYPDDIDEAVAYEMDCEYGS